MKNKVILVTSDEFGKGEAGLGKILLENFFVLVKQGAELPAAVFFLNRGVFTLTDQSLASVHIKELAEKGIPILACKTCVDQYELQNQLTVGEISSMKRFLELAASHEVLTIS